jgi:hypothetical protein
MFTAILPCGAATSQNLPSSIDNSQVQAGDLFSQQTLDVVDVTDLTTATTTATANSFGGSAEAGDLNMTSSQALQSNVTADTTLNVQSNSGASTILNTAATGNTADAGVFGGVLRGTFTQTTDATQVTGRSHIEAPGGQAGDVSSSVQAIGNSQGFGVTAGGSDVTVSQTNNAELLSDGGGLYGYVSGTAVFSAATAANNVTAAGVDNSAQRLTVDQQNNASVTQASQFTNFGNANLTTTSATAAANNISAANTGPALSISAAQQNQAYVRAETVSTAYEFGAGSAVSYGVGNTLLAAGMGGETFVDSDQVNDGGGVEALASYSGEQGYDGSASATAIGNAATGYACAECDGRVTATNRQVSNADVGATSTLSIASGRSANGVATAIGNTASYYVSRPGE